MNMAELQQYEFFLLRYVPNAVTEEFINIGVVLLSATPDAPSGSRFAEARFIRDWHRVRCLDPDADLEMLSSLERGVRARFAAAGDREELLRLMNESFSGTIQLSATKGCLTESPQQEIEHLAALYLYEERHEHS
jgi:hypothetical protein